MLQKLHLRNLSVSIESGELISYQLDNYEYIHQKGSPGWRNSDTEMFPIIGPTSEAGFLVQTPKGDAVQDQHGLLREMTYELIFQSDTKAVYRKIYKARTPVANSKYPEKSTAKMLFWPYDFEFEKSFELSEDQLEIKFKISGERDTPFMLGYHPAFALTSKNPIIIANEKAITLKEVLAVGNRAFQVSNCEEIILKDKNELQIMTQGFGNFMLWTEVANMVCIEPITFYPYDVEQRNLDAGFRYLNDGPQECKIFLKVLS